MARSYDAFLPLPRLAARHLSFVDFENIFEREFSEQDEMDVRETEDAKQLEM